MRFFVASWFFPPSTSSEGIVTYKLFRNSKHHYDVCSSMSTLWSYQHTLPMEADNITPLPVETNEFDEWINQCVEHFEARHAEQPYDAIMTRSMPPESIEVARRILAKHPDIPWVASLADPIAKSPYDYKGLILEDDTLSDSDKHWFKYALRDGCDVWKSNPCSGVRTMCAQKDLEDYVINTADVLIFPCHTLKNYVLASRRRKRTLVVPHSYDLSLYPDASNDQGSDNRTVLSFIGHSDPVRSLEPIVQACNQLRMSDPESLERLHIRFIGNTPEHVRTLINNFYLYDTITVEPSVDYLSSLRIMRESDWLIHVDALFDFLDEPGGSIFFAGKLADYMGTDKPLFSLTGKGTPADIITERAGGVSIQQDDITGIARALADIAHDKMPVAIDRAYRDSYEASAVAKRYDKEIVQALTPAKRFTRHSWPELASIEPLEKKLLTICVPAYNVECHLDRCLHSFVTSEVARWLEVLVVNDGSPDSSREIALAYQEHYPEVIRLIDKENGGHGSTINAALAQASGLYFRVVDGDDWVDGSNLSTMLKTLHDKETYADLVSSNYHQVYISDGHTVNWMKKSGRPNYTLFNFADEDFTMEYFTMASMMVKTDILRKANFKIQEHTFYVDVEYILFPIPYIKTVMFTPEFIYRYAVGNADQSINPENFVKRYDHHDRVIRRMTAYYAQMKKTMGQGQSAYMRNLLESQLLRSHYLLSLAWDTDRTRGYARAKDFDLYLKQTDENLYRVMGEMYPAIKQARRKDFDSHALPKLTDIQAHPDERLARRTLRRLARVFSGSKLGDRLVHNRYTARIARHFD